MVGEGDLDLGDGDLDLDSDCLALWAGDLAVGFLGLLVAGLGRSWGW